ncbi:TPA: hypothetical protein DD617_03790 [Candidatus Uhrbacteria bacterium]|jgi:ribokinase|nr:hypothetical protein [Candidatus Uhrbacteria bacterium]
MSDVITIGASTRDVFLFSDQFKFISSDQFETGIGECVTFGTKIDIDRVVYTTGGGATNTASTFARLGFSTACVSQIGEDTAGKDVVNDLKHEGIKTSFIRTIKKEGTAYSTLLTAPNGERTVLVYRGASAHFVSASIPWKNMRAHCFYLTSLGGNIPIIKQILHYAQKQKTFVVWNPGAQEIEKGLATIQKLLPFVDVFSVNREEAEKLTGEKEITNMMRILTTPHHITIVTDGARGAYAYTNGHTFFATSTDAKAISRTGAGDAFGSGFVAGFLKTQSLESSLKIAVLNAESVIQKIGAKAGILHTWPSSSQMKRIRIEEYT